MMSYTNTVMCLFKKHCMKSSLTLVWLNVKCKGKCTALWHASALQRANNCNKKVYESHDHCGNFTLSKDGGYYIAIKTIEESFGYFNYIGTL